MASPSGPKLDSPAELVAIARAAHLAGDRNLERAAKRELKERFGVVVTFLPRDRRSDGEASCQ